ncbi:MAG: FAD-dependent oxidoreductase [Acutalibacteraceae bacterium]
MKSVWQAETEMPKFSALEGDEKTDVLIIGGGIAGLLCAYQLKKAGVDCIVAEAKTVCSGITKNTTAKLTYHHGAIFDKMIKRFGVENAKLYVLSQKEALREYEKLCNGIDCNFEKKASFVYSLVDERKILLESDALNKIGCKAEIVKDLPLPFSVAAAVRVENQAQFNPLKFASEISKGLKIFENTKVIEIRGKTAETNRGRITAEKIIAATHFPSINKYGGYFFKMYQHRSYVIALENAADVNGIYIDQSDDGLSFRNYGNLLLLGGGSHRTGKKGGNYRELRDFALKHYPNSYEKYHWATQDCITLDDVPYIGRYSPNTPDLFVMTGFNKWGMTSAMTGAMLLCDLVLGRENIYSFVYSPERSVFRPRLFSNGAETLLNLLTPTVPRCPHLGCALKYNRAEHTWDCPCHGSRFEENGKLIDNPATDDKKM